jgi:hypothetical protein
MARFGLLVALAWLAACWSPPAEGRLRCGPSGECPGGWFCRDDGLCWSTAEPDAGRGDASDPTARVCGFGDAPLGGEVPNFLVATTGRRTASLSSVDVSTPFAAPFLAGGELVPPSISVAGNANDRGVVATATADTGGVILDTLDLANWEDGRVRQPVMSSFDVRAVDLRESGGSMRGVYVRNGPSDPGEEVARRFEFFPLLATLKSDAIYAGDPPNAMRGGTAVLGGDFEAASGAPTSSTLYFIAHERLGAEVGPYALGAVESSLSLDTYRTTLTPMSLAADDLWISGPEGPYALLQNRETFAFGLWQVEQTQLFLPGLTRGDDVLEFPDLMAAGAASLARNGVGSSSLMLALPVSDGPGGSGPGVSLQRINCPGENCALQTASFVSTGESVPRQVVLNWARGAYVLTVLHAAGAEPPVEILWIDSASTVVARTPVELPAGMGSPVAIDADVTPFGFTASLFVGILLRDGATDRTAVLRVRGCGSSS